jgi:hypothetical protein
MPTPLMRIRSMIGSPAILGKIAQFRQFRSCHQTPFALSPFPSSISAGEPNDLAIGIQNGFI